MRHHTRFARLLMCVALGALVQRTCLADSVVLSDGSRLQGKIVRLGDGKLAIETSFAGTLEIDASAVTEIVTDRPVNVGLSSGDRLVGRIGNEEGRIVVNTAMGPVPIEITAINTLWGPDDPSPEQLAMEAEMTEMRRKMDEAQPKWMTTLEAGSLFTQGNSELFQARGGLEFKRVSPKDILRFYLKGEYSRDNNLRNAAEAKVGSAYEYAISEKWFSYASSELEYDEFESLNLRATVAGGAGYYWVKKPDHELKNRLGVGFQHEEFFDGSTRNAALLDVGLDYRVDLTPYLQFTHAATYYPTFRGLDEYRFVFDNAMLIPLADSDMWKLKLGALYEYNSMPVAGNERLDQTYYGSIVVEIK